MNKNKAYIGFKYMLFILLTAFLVFPLYWIISTAFRSNTEILSSNVSLIPKSFTLEHFKVLFVDIDILNCMKNSLTITLFTVFISVFVGALMAYILERYVFKGRNTIQNMILFTQFVPMVSYIIPLYLIMSKLGLLNTYASLIITYLGVALPVGVVMLVNFIKDVPIALEEAARIDGCTNLQIMLKIVLPLSVSGIISTSIYIFITIWQEYLVAVSFITRESAYTVSLALTKFQGAHGTDWGGIMAGAVFISIPTLALFVCFRKLFTDRLSGGVKG
ncbi:MAG: carbohydrate ABC transporter permease [Lachnospirales bacterium]